MKILIVFLSILFSACKQPKKNTVNFKAILLADSAYKLVRTNLSDTTKLKSAIKLLKQSTEIDSTNMLSFQNILTYQMILKDYGEALITAKRMSNLRPQNADYFSTLGILYELNNDSISSKPSFKEAIRIYTKVLDTLSDQKTISSVKSRIACNLLFANNYYKGQALLKDVIQNSNDTIEKEGLKLYLDKTGREIILMILKGE